MTGAQSQHTAMEDKTIHAYNFVSSDTDFLNKPRLIAKSAQRRKQPAVSVATLTDIARCWAIVEELRFFENVLEEVRC